MGDGGPLGAPDLAFAQPRVFPAACPECWMADVMFGGPTVIATDVQSWIRCAYHALKCGGFVVAREDRQ